MNTYLLSLIVFWIGVAGVFYIYIGYPLLVWLVRLLRPRPWRREDFEPPVSIVIAARNEEKDIESKLKNTLAIDYPTNKLEIIVVSDFSSDRTDNIVESFADKGVTLIRPEQRLGKTAAQNLGVSVSTGEIILFSDATTNYQADVLRRIIPNFADESIGCVGGKLDYHDPHETTVGRGASNYWSYETNLKVNESLAGSLIGVSGCLYAVRRSAYKPMYPEACSDFLIATVMRRQGLRTVFEPSAVCDEETNVSANQEFAMRTRIAAQTLSDLWRNVDMMNPSKSGFFAISLVSHKLLRYLTVVFFLLIFLASIVLASGSLFYLVILIMQALFWITGFLALIAFWRSSRRSVLTYPAYFVLITLASVAGLAKFLFGEKYEKWEPIRNNPDK